MADSVKTFLQDLARVSTSMYHLLIFLLQDLTRKSFRFLGGIFVTFVGSLTYRFSFSSTILRRLSIYLTSSRSLGKLSSECLEYRNLG